MKNEIQNKHEVKRSPTRRLVFAVVMLCVIAIAAGCAAYQLNTGSTQNNVSDSLPPTNSYGTVIDTDTANNTLTARIDPARFTNIQDDQVTLDCSTIGSVSHFSAGDLITFQYFDTEVDNNTIKVRAVSKELKASGIVTSKDTSGQILTARINDDSDEAIRGQLVHLRYCDSNTDKIDIDTINSGDTISFYYYEDSVCNNQEVFPVEILR